MHWTSLTVLKDYRTKQIKHKGQATLAGQDVALHGAEGARKVASIQVDEGAPSAGP